MEPPVRKQIYKTIPYQLFGIHFLLVDSSGKHLVGRSGKQDAENKTSGQLQQEFLLKANYGFWKSDQLSLRKLPLATSSAAQLFMHTVQYLHKNAKNGAGVGEFMMGSQTFLVLQEQEENLC